MSHVNKYKRTIILLIVLLSTGTLHAQDDLLKMLGDESNQDHKPVYTTATFKSTRLINGHSVENVGAGVLDLRISHRFGYVNSGVYNFYGLDEATMRLGLDYGLTNRWMVGIGRSTYQKQVDAFTKYKIFRQSSGSHSFPFTISWMSDIDYRTLKFTDPTRDNYLTSNLYYTHQLLIGRKMSEVLSLQVMPTLIHYNLVSGATDPNDLLALGMGGRIKVSKRVSLNAEYYYQLPGYKLPGTYNSIAVGIDIETGGHVFQLHFTNSTGMTERTFISETTGNFFKGDIHFGFNISRVFTIKDPRKRKG